MITTVDLWTEYNKARTAFYRNPTNENEARMDELLRRLQRIEVMV